jgi:hypothetical protein
MFIPENLPDSIPLLKEFATRILTPTLQCKVANCNTSIGRLVQVPEGTKVGLIRSDTLLPISDSDITGWVINDIYTVRVRDTSSCLVTNGFCRVCGSGYKARIGEEGAYPVGSSATFEPSARAFQNYIANTYSGAIMGWSVLSSDPLPTIPDNWSYITSHDEMDRLARMLLAKGLPRDDYDYILSVTDILEKALLLIGTYGVYGNV